MSWLFKIPFSTDVIKQWSDDSFHGSRPSGPTLIILFHLLNIIVACFSGGEMFLHNEDIQFHVFNGCWLSSQTFCNVATYWFEGKFSPQAKGRTDRQQDTTHDTNKDL